MLVKLGKIWVNPYRVIALDVDLTGEVSVKLDIGSLNTEVSGGSIDILAGVINNETALQSFGGEDDKEVG
jgi:hypothetical protein